MSDFFSNAYPVDGAATSKGKVGENDAALSVSEISSAIKATLESRFDRVRVRGEISGLKRAASGHVYLSLKDESAVINCICWRGSVNKLSVQPEEGMEVIATGRISSYPGRSNYQLIIERMELAGQGALLKMLEERKKALAAQGLFAAERKKPLPFLPDVIGVVTSPTGAVIRDILHRLSDRFPRHVILWPVTVQGDGAAAEVASAIRGFNAILEETESQGAGQRGVRRPDLLIVARGGGSLEDLWAFNEEQVVRAVAESSIPLISAVGHETDTTLIDFASDRRAPTPSAAAEMAVPVRGDLIAEVTDLDRRLFAASSRITTDRKREVKALALGLPNLGRIVEEKSQRLDDSLERLAAGLRSYLAARQSLLGELVARLPHPRQQLRFSEQVLTASAQAFALAGRRSLERKRQALQQVDAPRRLRRGLGQGLARLQRDLLALGRLLESTSYKNVLKRGFSVVRSAQGDVLGAKDIREGMALTLEFAEKQSVIATAGKGSLSVGAPVNPLLKRRSRQKTSKKVCKDEDDGQSSLF